MRPNTTRFSHDKYFGLGTKITWLGLGKHHGLRLNNNVAYVTEMTKVTYITTKMPMLTFGVLSESPSTQPPP